MSHPAERECVCVCACVVSQHTDRLVQDYKWRQALVGVEMELYGVTGWIVVL